MAIKLENLELVRMQMINEFDSDVRSGRLYISPKLNEKGTQEYPNLLKDAMLNHNDSWLASQILGLGLLKQKTERKLKSGKVIYPDMSIDAHETLAEGEFNRFYLRGLCCYAIENGIKGLQVYRGKLVLEARTTSEELIGTIVDPKQVLEDLRTKIGEKSFLGIPGGPNSGISLRIPV